MHSWNLAAIVAIIMRTGCTDRPADPISTSCDPEVEAETSGDEKPTCSGLTKPPAPRTVLAHFEGRLAQAWEYVGDWLLDAGLNDDFSIDDVQPKVQELTAMSADLPEVSRDEPSATEDPGAFLAVRYYVDFLFVSRTSARCSAWQEGQDWEPYSSNTAALYVSAGDASGEAEGGGSGCPSSGGPLTIVLMCLTASRSVASRPRARGSRSRQVRRPPGGCRPRRRPRRSPRPPAGVSPRRQHS